MKSEGPKISLLVIFIPALLLVGGCNSARGNPAAEAPPPAAVVADTDVSLFSVDHPEQFPLAAAVVYAAAPKLVVTGTVNPDISRNGVSPDGQSADKEIIIRCANPKAVNSSALMVSRSAS